jgi:hypothetical protein
MTISHKYMRHQSKEVCRILRNMRDIGKRKVRSPNSTRISILSYHRVISRGGWGGRYLGDKAFCLTQTIFRVGHADTTFQHTAKSIVPCNNRNLLKQEFGQLQEVFHINSRLSACHTRSSHRHPNVTQRRSFLVEPGCSRRPHSLSSSTIRVE